MKNVGLVASSVGHVAVLAWALISLPSPGAHDVSDLEILPIELVSVSDVTDVVKGQSTAKVQKKVQEATRKAPQPEEKKPEPAPKVAPKPKQAEPQKQAEPEQPKAKPEPAPKVEPAPKPEPSPKPEPAAKPEPAPKPEPTPKVEPEKKVEPQPEPTPKAEEKPQSEPTPEEPKEAAPKPVAALPKIKPKAPPKPQKPAEEKRKFDVDSLKALANQADSAQPTQSGEQDQDASFGSRNGREAAAMTQSELDALRAQIAQCWSPPVGAADASQLAVKIEFGLDQQGNVNWGPQPIEYPANQFGVAAVESAMRAVRRCAPYTLPADKYDAWRRVRINFDPSDMF
ncbi:cell envelope biogenesis protein TolA [Cohaesibacter haloalkalitolerans]|uniref:cell envelope biogenesis protein TolA n=1 Tax=Cohaesibacter haloalkalitolerans TaxID=1162980 RepID=UPI000E658540|nr:cell envelope biogenesis protein TolA [Cohaesibacter haloalkalitolerans]